MSELSNELKNLKTLTNEQVMQVLKAVKISDDKKDARIKELEEREKKLVDMIRKYCICSSMYSNAGDCSFCTNLKELGVNNE